MKKFGKPELQELHNRLDYVLLDYPKISTRLADTRPVVKNGVQVGTEFITGSYKAVDSDGNVYLITYREPVNMAEFTNSLAVEGRPSAIRRSKRLIASWDKFRAVSDERMADASTVDYVERRKASELDV